MIAARRRAGLDGAVVAVRDPDVAGPFGVPGRPRHHRRPRGPEHRADPHRVRPRPTRGVAGAHHPRRRRRRRHPDAHRPRPGGGAARTANLVRAGALRGRRGQRGAPAPVAGRRRRPAVLRRGRAVRHPAGRRVRDRRRRRRTSRSDRGLRGFGTVGAAAQAGQLGRRRGVLGSGEPRSRRAVHRGHPGQPARCQRRAEARSTRAPTRTWRPRPSWAAPCAASTAGSSCPPRSPRTRLSRPPPQRRCATDQRSAIDALERSDDRRGAADPRNRSKPSSPCGGTNSRPSAADHRPRPRRRCAWRGAVDPASATHPRRHR